MADVADVLDSLTALVAGAVYPSGTSAPSVTGAPVVVYPGWPISNKINADIEAGKSHVSIWATEHERNVTRHFEDWIEPVPTIPTLTATVANQTVTLGGTVTVGETVTVAVNNQHYSYTVVPGNTLASIASSLRNLINVSLPATVAGPVISIPTAYRLTARVSLLGTVLREISRYERLCQVITWSPSHAHRTALSRVLDRTMARTRFLEMPDRTLARLVHTKSQLTDHLEKQGIYRKDAFCTVDYAITEEMAAPLITATTLGMTYQTPERSIGTWNR